MSLFPFTPGVVTWSGFHCSKLCSPVISPCALVPSALSKDSFQDSGLPWWEGDERGGLTALSLLNTRSHCKILFYIVGCTVGITEELCPDQDSHNRD